MGCVRDAASGGLQILYEVNVSKTDPKTTFSLLFEGTFRRTVIKRNSSHDFKRGHHCLNKCLWPNHSTRSPVRVVCAPRLRVGRVLPAGARRDFGPIRVRPLFMSVERAGRPPGSRCIRKSSYRLPSFGRKSRPVGVDTSGMITAARI